MTHHPQTLLDLVRPRPAREAPPHRSARHIAMTARRATDRELTRGHRS